MLPVLEEPMSSTDIPDQKKQTLREMAEALTAEAPRSVENLTADQMKNLIHEYQVHQVELELQNEELRATQHQLKQVKDRYADLFNNAPTGYIIVDSKGIITKANETFASMIGKTGHDLGNRLLSELVIPEDRSALLGRFKAFFKNPEEKCLDFGLIGPKNKTLYVRCVGRRDKLTEVVPEHDTNQGLLLMASDITNEIGFQEKLKKSEEQYRELVENAPIGIFQSTPEGQFLTVNTEMAQLYGFTNAREMLDEVTNITAQLYARPEDREIYKRKLLNEGEVKNFEVEMMRRDGSTFWASMNTKVKPRPQGSPVFDGFLMDVTQRCLAQQELHLSHQRLATVLDSIEALIYIVDMDTYQILFINAYGRKMCGNAFGKKCWDVLQQDQDGPCPFCTNVKLLKDGKPTGIHEWSFQNTKNQRWYLCQDSAIPWTDGRFVRMEIATDITDRKRIEDEVRRYSSELKALLAEKDKFFSIIAHDLKSPISSLLSLARMFEQDVGSMTIQDLQKISSLMRKSTERLYALLENLLQWALVQQGMIAYSPQPFNLHELIHDSTEALRSVAEMKEIVIQATIPGELTVMVDTSMITTVVRNLVSNALKYTDSNGRVAITAALDQSRVQVSVEDTGMGMDPHTLTRVFSLDQKASCPGTRGESGTGLGLILCKEFVEKHGGHIWVESEPGKGSAFHFTLSVSRTDKNS
jgi:PAS domain S-box-containing protein